MKIFKTDTGRRAFAKLLKSCLKQVRTTILNDNSFELILYLFNTVLENYEKTEKKRLCSM